MHSTMLCKHPSWQPSRFLQSRMVGCGRSQDSIAQAGRLIVDISSIFRTCSELRLSCGGWSVCVDSYAARVCRPPAPASTRGFSESHLFEFLSILLRLALHHHGVRLVFLHRFKQMSGLEIGFAIKECLLDGVLDDAFQIGP